MHLVKATPATITDTVLYLCACTEAPVLTLAETICNVIGHALVTLSIDFASRADLVLRKIFHTAHHSYIEPL